MTDEISPSSKKKKFIIETLFPSFTLPNTILLPKIRENEMPNKFNKTLLNRIYVGNLGIDVKKQDLKSIFEEFGAIKSISIGINHNTHKCKGFGFVELDNPHGASLAIESLKNVQVCGKILKINRPVNYPKELPNELLKIDPTLIYISNIHTSVTEEDLEKIMRCIGDCKVYLIYRNGYSHIGYGFVKFAHHSMAKDALKIDVNLGGKRLRIGPTVIFQELYEKKRIIDPEIKEIATEIEKEIFESDNQDNCLVLKNLIDLNELDTEFVNEMEREMKKYGTITDIQIKINQEFYYEIKNVVVDKEQKEEVVVFVIFEKSSDLDGAVKIMKNRYFGGRRIRVETCRI
ncbi:Poly(U)-binding-splicing factor half pint [Dictyocoela muelleri]|nr:Poly(U)-binding-splicing factor half pint [Dictyocoela muelleri]